MTDYLNQSSKECVQRYNTITACISELDNVMFNTSYGIYHGIVIKKNSLSETDDDHSWHLLTLNGLYSISLLCSIPKIEISIFILKN
jgi:hypothetical protein